jgi:flagellar biosynthesis protein FlhF
LRVRKELGPNALILSSRSLSGKNVGIDAYRGKRVEITAAVESSNADFENKNEKKVPKIVKPRGSYLPFPKNQQTLFQTSPESTTVDQLLDLGIYGVEIRSVLLQLGFDPLLVNLFKKLDAHGVDSRVSLYILEQIRNTMGQSKNTDNRYNILRNLRKILKQKILIKTPVIKKGKRPEVICMVGSTGVGKTTTLAKLAAKLAFEQNKKVVLATLDTYRIAAAEQLRVYAQIMELPFGVVKERTDIRNLLHKHREADVILLDTAGRSPNNDEHLNDLRMTIGGKEDLRIYLLISANIIEEDMVRAVERFSVVDLGGLIFTKLDECTKFGAMFNIMYRANLPITYFTTGQKVPDDLENADIDRVLKRIFTLWN